jgi:glucokinase
MSGVIIGVDLGGTRVRAARLDKHLRILERHETLTHADEGLAAVLQRIKDLIREVLPTDGTPVEGIGISAPGPLNPKTGVIVAPPNLPGWHNVPLSEVLQAEFNVPVYCGNDANVAAMAEAVRGAARGYRHVIYLTVSTGIGSGIIYDGRLLLGKEGLAAEAGHIQLLVEGEHVSSLEKEASGTALGRQARALIAAGRTSKLVDLVDGDIEKIDAQLIGEAAHAGDPLALELVTRCGKMVGLGIVSLLHLFNPEIVVIGGGVSNIGEPLFTPMHAAIKQYALDEAYWGDLKIAEAGLGGDVSIIGAATLVATDGGTADISKLAALLED